MRVYSHPVKYTDKDGNTKDITLYIQSRPGGVLSDDISEEIPWQLV